MISKHSEISADSENIEMNDCNMYYQNNFVMHFIEFCYAIYLNLFCLNLDRAGTVSLPIHRFKISRLFFYDLGLFHTGDTSQV